MDTAFRHLGHSHFSYPGQPSTPIFATFCPRPIQPILVTGIHDTMVRGIASAEAPQNPKLSAASTKSVSTAPLSRLASKDSIVAPRPTSWTGASVKEVRKLTPTPETRPTTIEGWTLREVVIQRCFGQKRYSGFGRACQGRGFDCATC
jgi:hypothetical protein